MKSRQETLTGVMVASIDDRGCFDRCFAERDEDSSAKAVFTQSCRQPEKNRRRVSAPAP
jgi:hypothetical protein